MAWTYNTPDDTPNDGPKITIIATIFTSLSFLILCLRFYVRGFMIKAVGADDYVLVVTWIAACGFAIVTIFQTKWGLGLKFIEDMPNANVYNFGLLQFMGAPFYITSILGFKLSLLLSYLRFMTKGAVRTATIIVAASCCMFHLSFLLVQLNLCQPVAKQWDPAIKDGHCIVAVPFYTSMASLTIVFDIAVMLLPFPVLVKSQIQARKKLVLLGLFALGIFITVIQIIRLQTISNLSNYLDSSGLIMWSTVENNLGIMVASVPTLAPLFKYFADKSRSGYYKNTHGDRYNQYGGSSGHGGNTTKGRSRVGSKYGMHSRHSTWRDGGGGGGAGDNTRHGGVADYENNIHHSKISVGHNNNGGGNGGHGGGVYAMRSISRRRDSTSSPASGAGPEDSQERILTLGSTAITKKTDIVISHEVRTDDSYSS